MRIIADRKDYYDCIQSCAQDRTKIYVRHEEEIHWERNEWPFPSVSLRLSMLSGIYIIGFCGKIYPMIQMSGESDRYGNDPPSVCCYSMKELNEFLKSSLKPNEWEYYLGTQKRTRNRYWQSWEVSANIVILLTSLRIAKEIRTNITKCSWRSDALFLLQHQSNGDQLLPGMRYCIQ